MKYYLKTYGCQMNVRDAEAVSALLDRHGHEAAASEDEADVVIVNTCSVRGKAEDKAIGKLGLMTATKRTRPDRIVGAVGCMVQRMGEQLFERVPELDFAAGTRRLARVPAILDQVSRGLGPVLETGEGDAEFESLAAHGETGVSAFVNILYGCNRRCTYCIVPDVRGEEWSRAGADVVAEVTALSTAGVKEVTLLGQSVMSYGRANEVWEGAAPSPGGYREPLTRLLEACAAVPGIARLRFTSGHPSGCTDELARAMAELPAVGEHLHLPLQSGHDRILKLMRRGYTADGYRRAVARLRAAAPEVAITTDIIVGFPSETEDEFDATRAFMEEIGFDQAFVFKYSPRPGTPAAGMADDVTDEEKRRRNQALLGDQDARSLRINEALVGRELEVLVEGVSQRNTERWTGRTRTNKIVVFAPPREITRGALVTVRIDRAMPQTLYGQVTEGTEPA